jgi:hypothetical protein
VANSRATKVSDLGYNCRRGEKILFAIRTLQSASNTKFWFKLILGFICFPFAQAEVTRLI